MKFELCLLCFKNRTFSVINFSRVGLGWPSLSYLSPNYAVSDRKAGMARILNLEAFPSIRLHATLIERK